MYRSISALIAAALFLSSSLSLAADKKPVATSANVESAKTTGATNKKSGASAKSKAAAQAKLVDINSASKAELMKLPGISDAEADKIIAGRPYLTKTRLVTKNIISMDAYEGLKKRVVAKQK